MTDLLRSGGSPAHRGPGHARALARRDRAAQARLPGRRPAGDRRGAGRGRGTTPPRRGTALDRLAAGELVTVDPPYVTPAGPRVRTAVLAATPRSVAAAPPRPARPGADQPGRAVRPGGPAPPADASAHRSRGPGRARRGRAGGPAPTVTTGSRPRSSSGPSTRGRPAPTTRPCHADIARALAGLGDLDAALASWSRARALTVDPAVEIGYAAAAADALADAGRQPDRSVRVAAAFALAARSRDHLAVADLALSVADEVAVGRRPVRVLMPAAVLLTAASAFDAADDVLTLALDRANGLPDGRSDAMVVAACRGFVRVRAGRVTDGLADLEQAAGGPGAARPRRTPSARVWRSSSRPGWRAASSPRRPGSPTAWLGGRPVAGSPPGLTRHALAEVASAQGHDQRALELYRDAGQATGCPPGQPRPAALAGGRGVRRDAVRRRRAGTRAGAREPAARPAVRRGVRRGAGAAHRRRRRRDRRPGRAAARGRRAGRTAGAAAPAVAGRDRPGGDARASADRPRDEAVVLLRESDAYATAESLAPLQQRARRLLDRLGAGPGRRREEALATLTTGERRTARLAAEGHTNQAIAERLGVLGQGGRVAPVELLPQARDPLAPSAARPVRHRLSPQVAWPRLSARFARCSTTGP